MRMYIVLNVLVGLISTGMICFAMVATFGVFTTVGMFLAGVLVASLPFFGRL